MAVYPISPAGQYGVLLDGAPHELPPNAWTKASNVHFIDGAAEKAEGQSIMGGTSSIAPYFAMSVKSLTGDVYWVYAGATSAYAYEVVGAVAGTHSDITRASGIYTAAAVENWQGGVLNGVPILNNGTDVPQMWLPVLETQKLQALSNWPVSTTAMIVRAYKNYLVALNVAKSGVRDTHLVKWSHPASAGAVPSTWDETDPTKDAGEYSLADTPGELLDCVPLRDLNIIYKTDSIWSMQWVGGVDIFRFTALFRNVGAAGKNCAVEYLTGRHFVLGKDDLFIHDGQTITSVARGKLRKWFYSDMNLTYASRAHVTMDMENAEVWVCYPSGTAVWPNKALIWNWVTGAWGMRELPLTAAVTWGLIRDGSGPALNRLLIASHATTQLLSVVAGATDFAGSAEVAEVERTGLGISFNTQQPPDISSMKFCSRIWPKLTGTAGTVVQVRFGTQMEFNETPNWGGWQDFTIGTSQKIDVTASGRLFAIGFKSELTGDWKLQGFDLDVQKLGNF